MQSDTIKPKQSPQRIKQIIEFKYFEDDQYLKLSHSCDQNYDWRSVLELQDWTALRSLLLVSCNIDDSGAEFVGSLPWPHLQLLFISYNKISPVGLKHLFLMPQTQMSRLKVLSLNRNKVGTVGAKLLIKAEFPILQELTLSQSGLGTEGVKQLAKGQWPKLAHLSFFSCKAKLNGCLAFASSNWKELKTIQICKAYEENDIVALLNLVTTSWPSKMKIEFKFNTDIDEALQILGTRYHKK